VNSHRLLEHAWILAEHEIADFRFEGNLPSQSESALCTLQSAIS
jgi:hypothetical protein